MKIGVNLTEAEAKAFKARKEQELGGGWCVDVYKSKGRWLARAYRKGKLPRAETGHQVSLQQRVAAGRHVRQPVNGNRRLELELCASWGTDKG